MHMSRRWPSARPFSPCDCALERAIQYSRSAGEAAAHWVRRFRGDDGGSRDESLSCPYAFFFTSLTLEKMMPSARSRV